MMRTNRSVCVTSIAITAVLIVFTNSQAMSAATFDALPYHAYSDTTQGAATISPFASVFGAISEQDPNGAAGETDISLYDFRGLVATPVSGQTYFFLEDFTDGQFDVPGVTSTLEAGTSFTPRTDDGRNGSQGSGFTDNVDEDDGANDNAIGTLRGSLRVDGTTHTVRFTFDDNVLGDLPTYVGIVRAEQRDATLTAFDVDDNVLEAVTVPTGSGSGNPDLTNDHFLGVFVDSGIAYVEVSSSNNNEYDHFQYGRVAVVVPEPSTLILAALGLVGLVGTRRRRQR